MRFWDSSAILSLLGDEPSTEMVRPFLKGAVHGPWWGTPVEVASALRRRRREGRMDEDEVRLTFANNLEIVERSLRTVPPTEGVASTAADLLARPPRRSLTD